MATMTYKQWLAARTRRAGQPVASSPTEAAAFKNWQMQQPEFAAQQQQTVAASNTPTALSPDDLYNAILKDPGMIDQSLQAQRDYTTGGAAALANWQTAKAQLAAQLPQYQHSLEMNQLNATRAGAARGTYQSGQTELDKQTAATDYANQVAQNQLQSQQADNTYQNQAAGLASDYSQNYSGAYRQAAQNFMQNRLDDFGNTYGINSGVGANVPNPTNVAAAQPSSGTILQAIPKQPQMTYQQFLAKHPTQTDNPTLKAKYKARFA